MSDLAAAAAAMGIPESLVQRSAEARAQETGSTVDDIISAWAGGGAVPTAPTPEPTLASESPAPAETPAEVPQPAVIVAPTSQEAAPVPAVGAVGRAGKPPVLVGATDNPMSTMIGAVGLFLLIFLVGLVGPATQGEEPGARTSEIQLSSAATDGMALYSTLGCAACHTQMVRPVVADIGLGAVTLNDANQPLGTRRFGPDLSDVGARMGNSDIQAVIQGLNDHPPLTLSSKDMSALVSYLLESNTSGGSS